MDLEVDLFDVEEGFRGGGRALAELRRASWCKAAGPREVLEEAEEPAPAPRRGFPGVHSPLATPWWGRSGRRREAKGCPWCTEQGTWGAGTRMSARRPLACVRLPGGGRAARQSMTMGGCQDQTSPGAPRTYPAPGPGSLRGRGRDLGSRGGRGAAGGPRGSRRPAPWAGTTAEGGARTQEAELKKRPGNGRGGGGAVDVRTSPPTIAAPRPGKEMNECGHLPPGNPWALQPCSPDPSRATRGGSQRDRGYSNTPCRKARPGPPKGIEEDRRPLMRRAQRPPAERSLDRRSVTAPCGGSCGEGWFSWCPWRPLWACLLYTSDAADE